MNLVAVQYMYYTGFFYAATTNVGNFLGERLPRKAKFYGVLAILMTLTLSVFVLISNMVFRY